jgi:antirestriction protein ArdC
MLDVLAGVIADAMERVFVLPARYIIKRCGRRTHVQPSAWRRSVVHEVGRRFDGPAALDRTSHKSLLARAIRDLGRPRHHSHAADKVADPQPLSRPKAQPT